MTAFTDPPENLMGYRPWLLETGGADWQPVVVEAVHRHRQGLVARFAGIEDRDAAQDLKGRLIAVPRRELPDPAPGEHYWRDLIGCIVINDDDRALGRVQDLIETGAHDVLVLGPLELPAASATETLLIPFHPRYIVHVDEAAQRILVRWPMEREN